MYRCLTCDLRHLPYAVAELDCCNLQTLAREDRMRRSFSIALALVLIISGWSTAHASASQSMTPPREWFTGWKPKNLTKLHRRTPLQLGILGTLDEILLSGFAWPFTFFGGVGACKYTNWVCNSADPKDADHARAK